MDDSNFFAHTRRLNIIGPDPNSTQFLRRRSSSTERLLIISGERLMATAASSFQKTDHPRWRHSPSPPVPLVPEKCTLPTESYMQLSLQSSLPLADPTASRKLLVLDLNGTLLLRSAHSGRRGAPPFPFSRLHQPALRTIYPRPYLPSFCAYIFHPTTLQWLDTMVWSSAQPHSVNDMLGMFFCDLFSITNWFSKLSRSLPFSGLLRSLITRQSNSRPTPETLPAENSSPFVQDSQNQIRSDSEDKDNNAGGFRAQRFRQRLDHFDSTSQDVFDQRYWVHALHYKPRKGAPVIVLDCGQSYGEKTGEVCPWNFFNVY